MQSIKKPKTVRLKVKTLPEKISDNYAVDAFVQQEKQFIVDNRVYNWDLFNSHLQYFGRYYPYVKALTNDYIRRDLYQKIINESFSYLLAEDRTNNFNNVQQSAIMPMMMPPVQAPPMIPQFNPYMQQMPMMQQPVQYAPPQMQQYAQQPIQYAQQPVQYAPPQVQLPQQPEQFAPPPPPPPPQPTGKFPMVNADKPSTKPVYDPKKAAEAKAERERAEREQEERELAAVGDVTEEPEKPLTRMQLQKIIEKENPFITGRDDIKSYNANLIKMAREESEKKQQRYDRQMKKYQEYLDRQKLTPSEAEAVVAITPSEAVAAITPGEAEAVAAIIDGVPGIPPPPPLPTGAGMKKHKNKYDKIADMILKYAYQSANGSTKLLYEAIEAGIKAVAKE